MAHIITSRIIARRPPSLFLTSIKTIKTYSRMASLDIINFSDGNKAPWLGYGTGTALYKSDAENSVTLAIKSGFRHLDGAQMYQNEDSLGRAIKATGIPRSDFFVTTKLEKLHGSETVESKLKESLQKLQLEQVDLYLIHSPNQHESRLKEVWKDMVAVKKAGLTKSIGVSNFSIKQLEEIISTNTEVPVVNQIEYHLFLFDKSKALLDFHKKNGIITESYAGLTPVIPGRNGPASLEKHRKQLLAVVDKAREARGPSTTQNQILAKYLQQKGILTVTTSSKESRIKEYLATQDLPPLSNEEIQALEESVSGAHYRGFGNTHMD